jgi:hypothetical protein
MSAGWMVSDSVLSQQLGAWLDFLDPAEFWYVNLFTNDYTPQPGDTFADYDWPTWTDYSAYPIQLSGWQSPSVTDHVATTAHVDVCDFPLPDSVPAQTVYGYTVTDVYFNLQFAEGFASPVVLVPGGGVKISPVLRLGIWPPPLMLRGRKGKGKGKGPAV